MGEPQNREPFRFSTSLDLTLLTNRRAHDLAELLAHVQTVPGSAIYYHTHHFLVQHQYLSPEPPNDFAYWVSNVLQEDRLGEQLAAIDLIQFRNKQLLNSPHYARRLGENGREHVRMNFLLTRHLRDYFLLFLFLEHANERVIYLT